MTAITKHLGRKIQEIFDKEKLEMGIYSSKNKLTHFTTPTIRRLRKLTTTRLHHPHKPTGGSQNAIIKPPGSLFEHPTNIQLAHYGGGFIPPIFVGKGECVARFCSKDNDDARRRLRLVEKGSWKWIRNNMEPKLSLECSNRLDGLYKNAKWDHCLKGKTAVVEVELILKE